MTLKEMLAEKLPQHLEGPSGHITVYSLGDAIGYKPQSVHEWYRKNKITIPCIELLMKIRGHSLVLSDFRPYCEALDTVLTIQEAESKKASRNHEY